MVVVDTDVIISSVRGNEITKQLLRKYTPSIYISTIAELELYIGATNKTKKDIVSKVLTEHDVIPVTKAICEIAIRLVKTYNTSNRSLYLSDALIAATCLHKNYALITFNTKDFGFIKGLHLAK